MGLLRRLGSLWRRPGTRQREHDTARRAAADPSRWDVQSIRVDQSTPSSGFDDKHIR